MSHRTSRPLLAAALAIFLLTTFVYYTTCAPTTHLSTMSDNNKNNENTPNLSHLHISLSQSASSPPTLSLAVTNTHPSSPLTLLTWNTPLDPLALQLGLLEVRPAGAHEPLPLATIKVSRKLPPGADSLVTLAPGESRAQEVVLREPIVPLKRAEGGKVAVVARGVWRAVWVGADVSEDAVARMGEGEGEGEAVLSGEWETESVVVEV